MKLPEVITKCGTKALKMADKYSPEILVAVGLISIASTAVLAVKATPKALSDIDEARREKKSNIKNGEDCQLTTAEIVKASWKNYIPAAVSGAAGIASIIGSRNIQARKISALGLACQAATTALDDKSKYVLKLEDALGKKKSGDVKQEIKQEKLDTNPFSQAEMAGMKKGPTLFFDENTGQYFMSDRQSVNDAFNAINARLRREMYIQKNELLVELGEKPVKDGDVLGWTMDRFPIEFDPDGVCRADNGEPCNMLSYDVAIEAI